MILHERKAVWTGCGAGAASWNPENWRVGVIGSGGFFLPDFAYAPLDGGDEEARTRMRLEKRVGNELKSDCQERRWENATGMRISGPR
jgi:hypothetical protein